MVLGSVGHNKSINTSTHIQCLYNQDNRIPIPLIVQMSSFYFHLTFKICSISDTILVDKSMKVPKMSSEFLRFPQSTLSDMVGKGGLLDIPKWVNL